MSTRRGGPYLVVWQDVAAGTVAGRCRAWAQRTGAAVDVVAPTDAGRSGGPARRAAGAVVEIPPVGDHHQIAATLADAGIPVVGVSRRVLAPDDPRVVAAPWTTVIGGRGTGGVVWALRHLHARAVDPPRPLRYGTHPAHSGELRVPRGARPSSAVVLVHGGFWRHEWGRDLMDGLAVDLAARGHATWNIEYRRVGPTGGGWPRSRDDVVAAVTGLVARSDVLAGVRRTVLLGHSAGAQLALRAAAQLRDRGEAPTLVVALAGLFDLEGAVRAGIGWGAVEEYLGGGPDAVPRAYRAASPAAHLPLGVPMLLAHGDADTHVPAEQSRAHHRRARAAGDESDLHIDADTDHFGLIDPTTEAWARTVAALTRRVPARVGRGTV